MRLIVKASEPQLKIALKMNLPLGAEFLLHQEGLTSLLASETQKINSMLVSSEPILNRYGAIGAHRIFEKDPTFLEIASSNDDSDTSRFSLKALGDYEKTLNR